jgi:hypothetical protein
MPELLYEQEGGKMEPSSKDSGGGPKIGANTIDMKIQLVDDKTTLPSYLIPKLTCDNGSTNIPASKVKVTLTGDSLRKETSPPEDFKCEITSNFLTDKEKSAITIETYYVDSSSNKLLGTNKIYFDESLLLSYDKAELKKSNNPFLATATTPDNGASYTFDFDFDKIITAIKELPSYGQIQNMFIFVNNIPGTDDVTKKTLINISPNGFLNLKFSGVPFSSPLTSTSKLTLKIETTQDAVPTGCDLKNLFGSDILTSHLHKVLELSDYKDFDFSGMAKPPETPPAVDPAVDTAAAAALADLAKAEAEHKAATAAAKAAATTATHVKTAAKLAINTAVDGIKQKMDKIADQSKIPPLVKKFIDASQALATAKTGGDQNTIDTAEAALKSASAADGLQKEIDDGLADGSTPTDVQDVLKNAKIIQDEHVNMDTADADVVNKKAAADAAEAVKVAAAAAAKLTALKTGTGTTGTAKAVNVVTTDTTPAASPSSKDLEELLQNLMNAQQKKLDDVIAQLKALQLSQATAGSNAAGLPPIIVRNPGESGACGKGDISMTSRDGLLIFEVPYEKVIGEIGPNMRSAMAQKVLARNAAGNAAVLNVESKLVVDPNAAEGAEVVVDEPTKTALQKAKTDLTTEKSKYGDAKTKLTGILPPPAVDSSAVNTAITAADSAITAADSAVATPQTLADAQQKVKDATAAVLSVTNAVKIFSDAVDAAKPAGAPGAGVAATLNAAEKAALQTAKTDLASEKLKLKNAGDLPAPDKVTALDTAIKEAYAAVDALESAADDVVKVAALNEAKTKINLLDALVKAATTAVDTAISAKPKPSGNTGPTFEDYQAAWKAYQEVKDEFTRTLPSDMKVQAGGVKVYVPPEHAATEQKAKRDEAVKKIIESVNKYEKIVEITDKKTFTDLALNAKQQQIADLKAATAAYTEALSKLKDAQAAYEKATGSGSSESSGKNAEDLAYDEAIKDIKKAIDLITYKISADSAASDAIANTDVDVAAKKAAESVNTFNNLLDNKPQKLTDAFAAIQNLGEPIPTNSKYLELLTNLDKQLKENVPHEPPLAEEDQDLPPPPASFEEQLKNVTPLIDTAVASVSNIIGLNASGSYTDDQVTKATQDAKNAAAAAEDTNFVEAAAAKAKADQTGTTGDAAAAATDAIKAAAKAVNTAADNVNKLQSDDKSGILDLIKTLLNNLQELKKVLLPEEEESAFSLFDGGSKSSSSKSNSSSSKSNSSSSKSSSKSKSKSKNKTKKNHSAPKSSKSKTPKIIMNE